MRSRDDDQRRAELVELVELLAALERLRQECAALRVDLQALRADVSAAAALTDAQGDQDADAEL